MFAGKSHIGFEYQPADGKAVGKKVLWTFFVWLVQWFVCTRNDAPQPVAKTLSQLLKFTTLSKILVQFHL